MKPVTKLYAAMYSASTVLFVCSCFFQLNICHSGESELWLHDIHTVLCIICCCRVTFQLTLVQILFSALCKIAGSLFLITTDALTRQIEPIGSVGGCSITNAVFVNAISQYLQNARNSKFVCEEHMIRG